MKIFAKSLLAVAALAVASVSQAGVLIDNFDFPTLLDSPDVQTAADTRFITTLAQPTATVGGSSSYSNNNGSIIGGQRDLFVIEVPDNFNLVSNPAGSSIRPDTSSGANIKVEAGHVRFSTDTGDSAVGIIRWDGSNQSFAQNAADAVATNVASAIGSIDAAGTNGFGAEDFASTATGFRLTVTSADLAFPFTLMAFSSNADFSVVTQISTGPGTYFIPFAGFVAAGGTGVDFGAVTGLQAIINFPGTAAKDVDLQLDIVERVPEPASVALVGVALLGLGLARRRVSK